jgi:hypothetical protein
MQDISLIVLCVLVLMMPSIFAMWLIVIGLLTIIYLLGVLRHTIRKNALRLQNEFVHSKSISSNHPIIIGRKEEVS